MSGCSWSNKSFSVAVTDKVLSVCSECKKEIDGLYRYNGSVLCQECFRSKGKNRIAEFQEGNFNTEKDLAYSFTTDMFNGKPVEIRSKKHFKTLLKQHGMVDASPKECFQHARYRKRAIEGENLSKREKVAETIYKKMKDRGQLSSQRKWR